MRYMLTAAVFGVWASGAQAEVPRVAVDIAPVHSIVSAVMGALGTPELIVTAGASPHGQSMRPSEARALDSADLIIWVGPGLTPWLQGPLDTLGADATVVSVLEVPGTFLLEVREGAAFGTDDHADEHEDGGHNDGADPHAWLDPQNAALWAAAIASELADQDPDNAAIYADNAAQFGAELVAIEAEVNTALASVRGRPFVVFHDAYHYFENRFGIEALGAVTANDASAASPARLSELQESVQATGAVCALTEPQFNPGILNALGPVKLGEIDPLGTRLAPGPALYPELLRNMAATLVECLG